MQQSTLDVREAFQAGNVRREFTETPTLMLGVAICMTLISGNPLYAGLFL